MTKANVISALLVLAAAALPGAELARAEAIGGFVVPSSQAARLQECVEPTEEMRRYHMELIRHQRDTTVYGGIRGTKHSLSGCVTCHVGYDGGGQPIDIDADGQFCNACHRYAAVTLNCFDCHATVPSGESWNQVVAQRHAAMMSGGAVSGTGRWVWRAREVEEAQ